MTNFFNRQPGHLIERERTNNIKVETSYCAKCGFNHYTNIGHLTCTKCGNDK